ncbi:hypothetical protein ACQPZ2_29665 [Nocardia pseudovaccinii]|uniref:hypothetical protein n=1 Tax=Nocardia pseudovaccinii TaxID=189540 RepID=UPI003D8AA1E3
MWSIRSNEASSYYRSRGLPIGGDDHRWLGDGFTAGEQLTPGAPWRIRLANEVRSLFVDDAPEEWLAMLEATLAYSVSRQTIMHRVKTGELQAVHVRTGRRKVLRIQPPPTQKGLF